jgi:hypothetical protein
MRQAWVVPYLLHLSAERNVSVGQADRQAATGEVMSETTTEAVLVEDDESSAEREQIWIDQMCKIRACFFELIDNGPTPEALQLARDLANELNQAVERATGPDGD